MSFLHQHANQSLFRIVMKQSFIFRFENDKIDKLISQGTLFPLRSVVRICQYIYIYIIVRRMYQPICSGFMTYYFSYVLEADYEMIGLESPTIPFLSYGQHECLETKSFGLPAEI